MSSRPRDNLESRAWLLPPQYAIIIRVVSPRWQQHRRRPRADEGRNASAADRACGEASRTVATERCVETAAGLEALIGRVVEANYAIHSMLSKVRNRYTSCSAASATQRSK